eukprot:TRINITY_DN32161_c0_g1_i1.p1 TRINITY_DN32161_c0_g1~~TRINITY_DN32161_c0_g1_i1.p1  ORF type:complete len:179 (+),score=26.76 TRINITY_DN32161_c0_g1_i1:81-539(+)
MSPPPKVGNFRRTQRCLLPSFALLLGLLAFQRSLQSLAAFVEPTGYLRPLENSRLARSASPREDVQNARSFARVQRSAPLDEDVDGDDEDSPQAQMKAKIRMQVNKLLEKTPAKGFLDGTSDRNEKKFRSLVVNLSFFIIAVGLSLAAGFAK